MIIGIARKYTPTGYMECEQCSGDSHQVRFASSAHKICISCEQDELRTCKCCDKAKPLTQYAVKIGSVASRGAICKKCKADARRLKYTIGARCCSCDKKIDGIGTGSKRYCEPCKAAAAKKRMIVIKSAFNVANYLAKPWRMSPC